MTKEKLLSLPVGTRVVWNKNGQHKGDLGRIAEFSMDHRAYHNETRYIIWDDGATLSARGKLRWVKALKFLGTSSGLR